MADPHGIPILFHTAIAVPYTVICYRMITESRGGRSLASRAYFYLGWVFLFCEFSGYVRHIFDWWPVWLAWSTHVPLFFAAWAFVIFDGAGKIAKDLDSHGGN